MQPRRCRSLRAWETGIGTRRRPFTLVQKPSHTLGNCTRIMRNRALTTAKKPRLVKVLGDETGEFLSNVGPEFPPDIGRGVDSDVERAGFEAVRRRESLRPPLVDQEWRRIVGDEGAVRRHNPAGVIVDHERALERELGTVPTTAVPR